ncbi:hypothetical protein [Burkholderia ubonensis]|uniref:hypothetical protein n=1 Tax=Burkholderia ubonensis TaxID=101571 RepID=UPI0012FC95B8|nr:hypothetical protein [Burkholderia ubonensis]
MGCMGGAESGVEVSEDASRAHQVVAAFFVKTGERSGIAGTSAVCEVVRPVGRGTLARCNERVQKLVRKMRIDIEIATERIVADQPAVALMRANACMGGQAFSERAAMASQCITYRETLRAGVIGERTGHVRISRVRQANRRHYKYLSISSIGPERKLRGMSTDPRHPFAHQPRHA